MIGFYDEGSGIFFPGDHVLNKITPNIGYYEEGDHSLANYIKNLEKIRDLPVSHVFPAHRGEVLSLQTRVDEIWNITGSVWMKSQAYWQQSHVCL